MKKDENLVFKRKLFADKVFTLSAAAKTILTTI